MSEQPKSNKMKLLIVIFMFFIIGALIIIGNNNMAMSHSENFEKFLDLYAKWLDDLYLNFQGITGQAVKMEWLPE